MSRSPLPSKVEAFFLGMAGLVCFVAIWVAASISGLVPRQFLPTPWEVALRDRPVYAAVGCPKCKWTGYLGRTGIYELLVVDEEMRRLVHDGAAESAIRAHGQARGMTMLRDDGLRWVGAGDTTVEEVLRVTRAAEVE